MDKLLEVALKFLYIDLYDFIVLHIEEPFNPFIFSMAALIRFSFFSF
jgi:hypothetical protein